MCECNMKLLLYGRDMRNYSQSEQQTTMDYPRGSRASISKRLSRLERRDLMISSLLVLAALTSSLVVDAERNDFNLQSAFDEEISIEPANDDFVERHQQQHHAIHDTVPTIPGRADIQSSGNESSSANYQQQLAKNNRAQQLLDLDHNDPFEVTFEDYLREASKSSAHHQVNYESVSAADDSLAINDAETSPISGETFQRKRTDELPTIDYVFPSRPAEAESRVELASETNKQVSKSELPKLINEIKSMFAWKRIATNKCSKSCGKGFRLSRFSCIDLKYNVRVEDELCRDFKVEKPEEVSDEPCNEFDCEPQWTSVEFQECNPTNRQPSDCHPKVYKRMQCIMVNKSGVSVYLDDSKCNSSRQNSLNVTIPTLSVSQLKQTSNLSPSAGGQSLAPATDSSWQRNREAEDEIIDISAIDDNDVTPTGGEGQRNDILSNIDSNLNHHAHHHDHDHAHHNRHPNQHPNDMSQMESVLAKNSLHSQADHHPRNEPFFQLGSWSECLGTVCGELGKRTRKVTCQIYLTKSDRFTELPESSCLGRQTPAPDSQEPCYLDCPLRSPEEEQIRERSLSNGTKLNNNEDTDETVYDLDLARFVWRPDAGWTKCSADCLGGKRESIVECWDKLAESAVEPALCEPDSRPQTNSQTCNQIPCQPEWRTEPFSKCTKSCGSAGIRSRPVACVQQVPSEMGDANLMVVSNDLCLQANGSMPSSIEPCNRIDCEPQWSVGPWSECSRRCGEGIRSRTVICVQEFASRDGPQSGGLQFKPARANDNFSPDLIEAVAISAKNWHPGKVTQVPFHVCYEVYKTVPSLDERCHKFCDQEPHIEADSLQNYRLTSQEALKRKSVTLKVGGRAHLPEGRNLKVRCRLVNRQNGAPIREQVEWRKDGVRIFSNGSTVADKQFAPDDNSIYGNDIFAENERMNQFMADEPASSSLVSSSTRIPKPAKAASKSPRNLNVRSWNAKSQSATNTNFEFLPRPGGRFALVRENTLRIKRLRMDDSGLYTCSYGSLSESLELKIVSRRNPLDSEENLTAADNFGQ